MLNLKSINLAILASAIVLYHTSPWACCSIRLDTPRFDTPRIPTPDEIVQTVQQVAPVVTTVVNDAGEALGQVATNVRTEAGIGLGNIARESQIGAGNVAREAQIGGGNVAREAQIGLGNAATTIRKAGTDTGKQLNRSQHDLESAGTAIYRFALHQIEGTKESLNHAEQRFREGKVIDALFHLGTEPFQNADENAAQAAQESQLLSTVGSVAASVYGGPQGAAAYAAWLTYHQTGDINMAIRVGIIAGASAYANGQASGMQTGTVTDSIKRAAVVGAIGGAAVAAAGGDQNAINQAFLRGGATILVQDGYKSYVKRDFGQELGPANGPAYCMSAGVNDSVGCPHAPSYMKDDQGRLIMTDKDGGFHHIDIGHEGQIPEDWRPIGDASSTPPGTPVVGIQTDQLPPLSQTNEGSATMIALAKVPGMNAMALFHDRWAVAWEMDPVMTKATIAPAIVLTYLGATATVDQASTTAITDAAAHSVQHPVTTETQPSNSTPASTPGLPEGQAVASTSPATPLPSRSLAAGADERNSIPPPEIREVKPAFAPLETLICVRGDSMRVSSVIPGKKTGDLQCMVYTTTDGVESAPIIAKNVPSYCAEKLVKLGKTMAKRGWSCKGR